LLTLVELGWEQWILYWHKIEHANLLQSWEYGEAKQKAQGWKPSRYLIQDEEERALGLVQILSRTLPFLGGVARINRGPLWFSSSPDEGRRASETSHALAAVLRLASGKRWWYLSVAPEVTETHPAREGIEKLGFRPARNPTFGSTVLSLEHTKDELFKNLKGKWRNLLRKAQRLDLNVRLSSSSSDIDYLIKSYAKMQQQAGFKGMPEKIIRHMFSMSTRDCDSTLLLAETEDSTLPVGMLVSMGNGDTCTYIIGWTSNEGRKFQANYILLWEAIILAKERGYRWFDLGGLSSSTPKGIAHFKSGICGTPYNLVGEWQWNITNKKKLMQKNPFN
jgi:lipid II:glycine glycyltransferase (peptidoglycan interpeptide bridge formation enzyme)